ncbi:MAG TPA: hypothetical protein VFW78_07430 [Bacteroidia bacterium]|nr:hypothetical protein [Bacteroidia bacterium]
MNRIQTLKDYLKNEPDDPFLKYALALEYLKTGQEKEAGLLFEQLVKENPKYLPVCYQFGKLLVKQGHTDLAASEFKRGMAIARQIGDNHTFSELSGALEELSE